MKPLKPGTTSFLLATLSLIFTNVAQAQITPDNTAGTTVINDTVLNEDAVTVLRDLIRGGTIRGNALFHSFEEFNVGDGREVIFDLQNANILNIFTRVTGGNASQILGVLGVLRDAASFNESLRDLDNVSFGDSRNSPANPALSNTNLFLLNPNGISFGVDAKLRINGSFLATTANGFEFEDGSVFSASGREAAPPLLTISIPRFLSFRDNPAPITNRTTGGGGLRVPGGQTFGLIGGEVQYLTAASRTPGGRVEIGAVGSNERVTLTETNGGYRVSYEGVDTFEDITLRRNDPENDGRVSNINVRGGDGSGSIQLQGRNVTLSNRSVLDAISGGSQNSGEIIVNASERFTLETDSRIRATVAGEIADVPTTGVSITINATELLIQSGGWIDAFVTGEADGGNITINATDSFRIIGTVTDDDSGAANSVFSQALENSAGNAGDIIINTGQFILEDGARVSADTSGAGNSGNIIVNANEFVQITGFNEDVGGSGSGSIVFTQAQESATGNAGNITINSPEVTIEDGGSVSVSSLGTVEAGNLAGNLTIVSDNLTLDGGSISADNNNANGGNINLNVDDLLLLRNSNPLPNNDGESDSDGDLISTEAGNNGGNININADFIVALPGENSDISADGGQNGGNITIRTSSIFGIQEPDGDESNTTNDITATGEVSGGDITITTLSSDFNQEVIDLPEEVVDSTDIVAQSICSQGFGSQLNNTGRGGVPQIPGFIIRNDVVDVELVDEVLPAPPPEAIKPHHRTTVTYLNSEGEEAKPAMGAVLLPNGMVEFVDYNPAEVYRDMYVTAGCSSNK